MSQKVCSILGEDSPTLAGIDGGVDVLDDDDITMTVDNEPVKPTRGRKSRYAYIVLGTFIAW